MKFILPLLIIIFALPVSAADYTIDKAQSTITFFGTHAGNDFEGVFEEWNASITFDAENLADSKITATFNTTSAKTGDKMYDGTLPQGDWFDSKNHPEATFESTSITANQDGSYKAEGNLTIRDITNPISFDFTLDGEAPTTASATFHIDRPAYSIGEKSDPAAEWVSQMITLNLNIVATKASP